MGRAKKKTLEQRRCHYCNRLMLESKNSMTREERDRSATVDHMLSKDFGGSNNPYNLVIACARCNNLKANVPYAAFMEFSFTVLRRYPDAPTPVLRRCMMIFIMHLVEVAMKNGREVRQACSLALLRMADELDQHKEDKQ